MTLFVSIDTESGALRRYDTRMRNLAGGWCRYIWRDPDWDAIRALGQELVVVRSFYRQPPHWAHVTLQERA